MLTLPYSEEPVGVHFSQPQQKKTTQNLTEVLLKSLFQNLILLEMKRHEQTNKQINQTSIQ